MQRIFLDKSAAGGRLEMIVKHFTARLFHAEFSSDGVGLVTLIWRPASITIGAVLLPPSPIQKAAGFGMLIAFAVRLGSRMDMEGLAVPAEFIKELLEQRRRVQ